LNTMEVVLAVGGAALGIFNTWLLFIIKSLKEEVTAGRADHVVQVERLRTTDGEMNKELAAIQVLVAGQYVTRVQFDAAMKQQTETILARVNDVFRYLKPPNEHIRGESRGE